ncbi:hypothetical protein K438DRAFT_1977077 [Mycena galopus ATCC 62051]|nr:hypothetical protein K438DRAFT_1977077 [Mycena galopus ATCC 62051]
MAISSVRVHGSVSSSAFSSGNSPLIPPLPVSHITQPPSVIINSSQEIRNEADRTAPAVVDMGARADTVLPVQRKIDAQSGLDTSARVGGSMPGAIAYNFDVQNAARVQARDDTVHYFGTTTVLTDSALTGTARRDVDVQTDVPAASSASRSRNIIHRARVHLDTAPLAVSPPSLPSASNALDTVHVLWA